MNMPGINHEQTCCQERQREVPCSSFMKLIFQIYNEDEKLPYIKSNNNYEA